MIPLLFRESAHLSESAHDGRPSPQLLHFVLQCLENVFSEQGSPMWRGGCAGVCCQHGLPTEGTETQNATRHPLPRGRHRWQIAIIATAATKRRPPRMLTKWRAALCRRRRGAPAQPPPVPTAASAAHPRRYAVALAVGLPSDRCGGAALGVSWFTPTASIRLGAPARLSSAAAAESRSAACSRGCDKISLSLQ